MPRALEGTKERGKAGGVAKSAQGPASRAASPAEGIRRAPRSEAIAIILADALADSEGFSFGAVGSPRYGKTHLLKEVIDVARTKSICEKVLIHDVKKPGVLQYEGAACASIDAFIAEGGRYDREPVVVFNSPVWLSQPTLNDACEVAMAEHEEGRGVLVVADEVFKGTDGYGNFTKGMVGAEELALYPLFLREGTSQRISTAWTTQIPQELPTACKVLTRAVAQFHLESLAADAATEKFRLDVDGPRVLRSLERGEFVLYCQGQEWNRTIYGPG